jgi:hypothetical protein
MNKPTIDDFNLNQFKLDPKGGALVVFNYRYSAGGSVQLDKLDLESSLLVHPDLVRLLKKQKSNVLLIEDIKYGKVPELAKKWQINNDEDKLKSLSDSLTAEALNMIEVTGIRLSGSDNNRKCIITYKKLSKDKKTAGRSTVNILLSGSTYGFEEELASDIEAICKEVWEYVYENKHADKDQVEIPFKDMLEDVSDEESINADAEKGSTKKSRK